MRSERCEGEVVRRERCEVGGRGGEGEVWLVHWERPQEMLRKPHLLAGWGQMDGWRM